MKVLIVAKTRQGKGACVGGITFAGRSVRLIASDAATNEFAGMEYAVGDVWEIEATPPETIIPPHVENIIVHTKRRLKPLADPVALIQRHMPPRVGGLDMLYEGLTQATRAGSLYIAERTGIPPYSTMFWRPDQPLQRDNAGKRIRYRYPTPDGGRTLTFVGFQEPLSVIPAGTLLRLSLAHWWRPQEADEIEHRCYVQLSGWFLPQTDRPQQPKSRTRPGAPVTPEPPTQRWPAVQVSRPDLAQARRLLKQVFGYDSFRPLQADIINNILQRRDTLAIMPTGSGKSLCFQLPALLLEGLTVVVSPLIALMQDQVDQLRELDVAAAYLNSTLSYDGYVATVLQIKQGKVKLLYIAPETLLRPETLLMLDQCRVDCLTIDEAHCISSWGHDFRPDYRQLLTVRQRLPRAVCLAVTATATERVRQDIKDILGFQASNEFIASFNRANLYLEAKPRTDGLAQTLAFLDAHRGESGIIYCSTQRQVETLTAQLMAHGWPALPYHGGMDDAVRQHHQRQFARDDVPIMVATIAFGMGINKSNVRFVLHYNLPENIETYYQQIGRAGRDGVQADCLLLYSLSDMRTMYRLIDKGAAAERPGRSARLQAMARYAQTRGCRRRPLLDYFGETAPAEPCQMCDNCLAEEGHPETIDVTIAAQKFLSCVKRTGEIFGVTHIIHVLRGSKAKSVLSRRHDRLSTYGIGIEYSSTEWRQLAQQFIEQGLVTQDMSHGSLRLTPRAYQVFKGKKVYATLEPDSPRWASQTASRSGYDAALFDQLRMLRRQCADAAGVPAYIIFSDRALMEMAIYYPQTPERFLAINGVGEAKLGKYGDAFLSCIRAYCQEHNLSESAKPLIPSADLFPITGKRRFEEVGELFAAGHSIEQLQAMYGVKQNTILSHLYRYWQAGYHINAERLLEVSRLSDAQREWVLATLAEVGPERLRPLYEALDETISFDELHILRLYYLCRDQSAAVEREASSSIALR